MTTNDPIKADAPMRFCKDCVHFAHVTCGYDGWDECQRPLSDERDPVSGKLTRRVWRNCANERRPGKTLFGRRQRCGPEGLFFQPLSSEAP